MRERRTASSGVLDLSVRVLALQTVKALAQSQHTITNLEGFLQVAIYGDFEEQAHPRKDEIITLLECGSANIVTVSQALVIGVHFVITKASRPASDPKIKQLCEAGLCIVAPSFVIEWVVHPWQTPIKVPSNLHS